MSPDSVIVEEVRRRRMELSARFDHDLERMVVHLRQVERQHADRLVNQRRVVRASAQRGRSDADPNA